MSCCNFCFCNSYIVFFYNFLLNIVTSTDFNEFFKLLSDFYITLIGVVGLLAVYRLQFYENNIKEARKILVSYVSVLKDDKQKDHNMDWYSYMDDVELENFIKNETIPQHQKDFQENKSKLKSLFESLTKVKISEEQKEFLSELSKVLKIINENDYHPTIYKDLSFNPSKGGDINFVHKCLRDIQISRMRVATFQTKLKNWRDTKEEWDHFKGTAYKILFCLILAFVFFFTLRLLSIKYFICIKFMLWIFGLLSIFISILYLNKFIAMCLKKSKNDKYLGILP